MFDGRMVVAVMLSDSEGAVFLNPKLPVRLLMEDATVEPLRVRERRRKGFLSGMGFQLLRDPEGENMLLLLVCRSHWVTRLERGGVVVFTLGLVVFSDGVLGG